MLTLFSSYLFYYCPTFPFISTTGGSCPIPYLCFPILLDTGSIFGWGYSHSISYLFFFHARGLFLLFFASSFFFVLWWAFLSCWKVINNNLFKCRD
ncbi:MAG: hypothetical protein J3R72DRAFT_464354 [Linnemannia gamsii]|nr:MAG: hypothetical protein J3R72DRAFT_464354 [Linnemannia gamsii]